MILSDFKNIFDGNIEAGIGIASVAAIMSVIQVSKLEINPWTWIWNIFLIPFKAIGKAMTSELAAQIASMSTDMKLMSSDIKAINTEIDNLKRESAETREMDEQHRVIQKRADIIRFGDDIRGGIPHSFEHYSNILDAITEYEHYCDTHPLFENSKAVATIQFIKKDYQERLETNNFL